MGTKGDKKTSAADQSAETLVEQLKVIKNITSKKMFGGYGIFHDGVMFGIIDSAGIPYLKIDNDIKPEFENAGGHQHSRMPYFSIPDDVIADSNKLVEWAERSINLSK